MDYLFVELVDVDELRSLCDEFTHLTGFVTAILDLEGNVVVQTGWQDICTRFHRVAPESLRRCRESDTILANRLESGERYCVYRCGNGLIDVAVPIIIDGRPVGRLYTGQFLFEPPDLEVFRRQGVELGFDEASYLDALKKVPVVTHDQVKLVVAFLCRLAEMIARIGLTNRRIDHASVIVKDSPAVLFSWKPTEDRSIQYVSYNVIQFGYKPEELQKTPYSALICTKDLQRVLSEVNGYAGSGIDRFQMEYRIVTRSGRLRWVDERAVAERDGAGNIVQYRGVVLDISPRKLAEEALRKSAEEYKKLALLRDQEKNLLRALIDSIPDLIFFKDPEGVYLGCNKAFEAFAGCTEKELTGRNDIEIFSKEVGEFFQDMDRRVMAQRSPRTNEEWVDYPDGRHVFLETLKTPFYDMKGRVLGLIGISRDMTERKSLEAQLQQAVKMEAVGQLAGGIAHDFNNILTAIMGYADILSRRVDHQSPLLRYVQQILTSSERAADLVNSLLAFSRKQVLHPKLVDLCRTVSDMKKMLGRIIGEDICFEVTVPEKELIVMADRVQIEQVIMNLVANARDAMPNGGTLSVEASEAFFDDGFVDLFGAGEPGHYACVTVADTGCGMDEGTKKKIFEPFFTTKEVGKGTGLGMAIIYGIVRQHNGHINLFSEPGLGTRFDIYFPLSPEEKDGEDPAKIDVPAGGTETILLVEDDDDVRELHRMVLEEAGYSVIEAIDGQDALEKFARSQGTIDMVATDVIMPNMDGKTLIKELEKSRPDLKALFMSGYTRDIVIGRGVLQDDSNFLSKPVTSTVLLAKVREILDRPKNESRKS